MFIKWKSSFCTGVAVFDEQHKKLFDIVGQLHSAITSETSEDTIFPILKELVNYAINHFAAEEKAMSRAFFRGYEAHKAEHDMFRAKVLGYLDDHMSGGDAVRPMDILLFISEWLNYHIAKKDA